MVLKLFYLLEVQSIIQIIDPVWKQPMLNEESKLCPNGKEEVSQNFVVTRLKSSWILGDYERNW